MDSADSIDHDWDLATSVDSPPADSPKASAARRAATWLVNVAGRDIVGMMRSEIAAGLQAGKLSAKNLVWREGMQDWLPLSEIPALRLALPQKLASKPKRSLWNGVEQTRAIAAPRPKVPPPPPRRAPIQRFSGLARAGAPNNQASTSASHVAAERTLAPARTPIRAAVLYAAGPGVSKTHDAGHISAAREERILRLAARVDAQLRSTDAAPREADLKAMSDASPAAAARATVIEPSVHVEPKVLPPEAATEPQTDLSIFLAAPASTNPQHAVSDVPAQSPRSQSVSRRRGAMIGSVAFAVAAIIAAVVVRHPRAPSDRAEPAPPTRAVATALAVAAASPTVEATSAAVPSLQPTQVQQPGLLAGEKPKPVVPSPRHWRALAKAPATTQGDTPPSSEQTPSKSEPAAKGVPSLGTSDPVGPSKNADLAGAVKSNAAEQQTQKPTNAEPGF